MHSGRFRVEKGFSTNFSDEKDVPQSKRQKLFSKTFAGCQFLDIRSEPSLGTTASSESGNVGRLFKMIVCIAVKVVLHLVTWTMLQVRKLYATHKNVFAVSRSGHMTREIVSSL